MSGVSKEWLLIIVFFITFTAYTFGEGAWLMKRAKTNFGKPFVGALLTNILAITVGYTFSAVILFILLALAWGGSLETVFGSGAGLWAVVVIGILIPFLLLFIAKRLMVKILQISESINPWVYALEASIGFFIATLGSVALFTYFL